MSERGRETWDMHLGIYFCCIVLFTPGCFEDGFCLLRISQVINIRRRRTLSLSHSLVVSHSLTRSPIWSACVCMVFHDNGEWVRERKKNYSAKAVCNGNSLLESTVSSKKDTFLQKTIFLAKNTSVFYRFERDFFNRTSNEKISLRQFFLLRFLHMPVRADNEKKSRDCVFFATHKKNNIKVIFYPSDIFLTCMH